MIHATFSYDRMIAFSPYLLESLQKIRILNGYMGHHSEEEALISEKIDDLCRTAIAKAEGK